VNLNGVFLLEINTFAEAMTIETFKIKKGIVNGREVFGGFERDAGGNLIIEDQTVTVLGGFKLLMWGQILIADVLEIEAEVQFRLELAGSNPGIELIVNGTLRLDPIGQRLASAKHHRSRPDAWVQ